jgi:PEP-CTERM motif-containing protein
MRFRKFMLAASLFLVCFMLSVRSAKADTIVINDNSVVGQITVTIIGTNDQVSLQGSILPPGSSATCIETVTTCQFNVTRAGFSPSSLGFVSSYLLAESTTTTIPGTPESDSLNTSLSGPQLQLHFNSDVPAAPGVAESPLGVCPATNGLTVGCNDVEDGTAKTVGGVIAWTNGPNFSGTDTVQVFSDTANESASVTPEPASLILFGSGLTIAGGFLRRRRRVATPSVVV